MKDKKCIFISCGTNDLKIIDLVMKKDWTDELGGGFKINKFYCFEPLENFNTWANKFDNKYDVEVEFINKAIWDENTTLQFYESENHFSSTLCSDKHTGSPKPKYKFTIICECSR